MIMNKKIITALSSLNISVAFLEYKGDEDSYVVFQVYNEEDADFSDDGNQAEIYYITVNYWYRKPSDMAKAKQIKALLKQNGFLFDGSQDLVGENFYGKALDFIFKEYI